MRLHGENQVQKKKKKFNQLWQGIQQMKGNNAHSEWKTGQAN